MRPFAVKLVKFSCTNEEHFEKIKDLIIYKMESTIYRDNNIHTIASDFLKYMLANDGLYLVQSKSYWKRGSIQEHSLSFGGEKHFKVHCVLQARSEKALHHSFKHLHLEMLFYEVKSDRSFSSAS
jgi:hypothetical protein